MTMRSNLTTPIAEKTQSTAVPTAATAPAIPNAQPASNLVPDAESNSAAMNGKSDDVIKVEDRGEGDIEGLAVDNHPTKYDDAVTHPATKTAVPAQPSTSPPLSSELSSVLSNLQALAGNTTR